MRRSPLSRRTPLTNRSTLRRSSPGPTRTRRAPKPPKVGPDWEALEEAADAWQTGQWADAPRRADRVQERLANAQHVTNWLRDRAAGGAS